MYQPRHQTGSATALLEANWVHSLAMGSAAYNAEVLNKEPFSKAAAEWKPGKGGLPLAAALGGLVLLHQLSKSMSNNTSAAQGRIDMKRLAEADRNLGDRTNLMGGGQLSYPAASTYYSARAENDAPNFSDFDKSAAVLAMTAGQQLAKSAGIGSFAASTVMKGLGAVNKAPGALLSGAQALAKPVLSKIPSLGLGGKILAGGALAGGGLLAAKAGKSALEFGAQPAQERRQGAPGPGLPRYINEYGTPSM